MKEKALLRGRGDKVGGPRGAGPQAGVGALQHSRASHGGPCGASSC